MKYTPGPWEYIVARQSGQAFVVSGEYDPDKQFSGSVIMSETTDPNSHANARLISAAPDLLEALEAVVADATDHRKTMDKRWLPQAQAAINKAKGGAE